MQKMTNKKYGVEDARYKYFEDYNIYYIGNNFFFNYNYTFDDFWYSNRSC